MCWRDRDAGTCGDEQPMIIDLNAWPSYAKYRDKASAAIADYLIHRFHRGPRAVN